MTCPSAVRRLVDHVAAGGAGALVLEHLDVLQLTPEDAQGGEDCGVVANRLSGGALVLGAGLGAELGQRLSAARCARRLVDDQPGGATEVHREEPLDRGAPALTGDGGAVEARVRPEGYGHLSLAQREQPTVLERRRVPRRLGGDRVQRGAPTFEERTRGVVP